jgi:hypothetical protein
MATLLLRLDAVVVAGVGSPSSIAIAAGAGALSRRGLLIGLVAGSPGDAAAPMRVKLSQAAALYQDRPRGGLSCVGCTFFQRPRACKVVEGDISPQGWCSLFDLPD